MSKFSTASSHMVIRKKYGHDKGSGLLRTPFGLVTWAGLFLPERSSQSVELSERRGKARVLPFFSAGPPHFPPIGLGDGKISVLLHTSLCIHYLDERKQLQNDRLLMLLGICFRVVWA